MDILRIIAIYLVVFNHTGLNGFFLFSVSQDSPFYSLYLFISIITKIAVPLFWMISGALLLKKDEPISRVLLKRVPRFFIVLLVFSAIQYIESLNFDFSQFSFAYFFTRLYSSPFASAYWYLYAYLGYLLMLPLLRKLVAGMKNIDFLYLISLRFLIALLPIAQFLIWKGEVKYAANFELQLVADVIFYPIIGHYAEHLIPEKYLSKKNNIILAVISLAAIIICCFMTHFYCTVADNWSISNGQPFHNVLTFIPTISLYLSAKQFFANKKTSSSVAKAVAAISGTTFGIMLTENIIRYNTNQIYTALEPHIGPLPASMLWVGAVCCIGGLIIFIIKLIPFMKKLI